MIAAQTAHGYMPKIVESRWEVADSATHATSRPAMSHFDSRVNNPAHLQPIQHPALPTYNTPTDDPK